MGDEFECEICMEDLIDSKTLPCGHSFCRKCKMNLLEFNDDGSAILNCPNQCENVTRIPSDQTIDDVIQTNYTLERWLASLHGKNNKKQFKCQGTNAHDSSPSVYCKHCRKLLCKTCFTEHECEGSNHIRVCYDAQKQCFHPICDAHKLFAEFICKQCNNTFLCIYCKNRVHKDHEKDRLESHLQRLKTEINARFEAAERLAEKRKQSEDSVLRELQNFREELTEELLLRKYINLNKYFAQLTAEESNVIKEFDDKMKDFLAQRKEMLNSCEEVKEVLEDRQEISNLVVLSEQNVHLETLQEISNDLLMKVVLHDWKPENHLGVLQAAVEMKEEESSDNDDCRMKSTLSNTVGKVIRWKIVSERINEIDQALNYSDFQKFLDDMAPKEYCFLDIVEGVRNGTDNTKLRLALKTETIQAKKYDLVKTAVENNQWRMLKIILDYTDANISRRLVYGTVLMMAVECGHTECVKVILEKSCDIDIMDDDGLTALMHASSYGRTECVKLLLEMNSNVDIKSNNETTALMLASLNGHTECVKLLLEKSCDVDITNNVGFTALMLASSKGQTECVKLLLEKSFDVDVKSNDGITALMLASSRGHTECVKLLLEKNSNVNIKCKIGSTALMVACIGGYTECVKLLLERNSNVDIKNNNTCSNPVANNQDLLDDVPPSPPGGNFIDEITSSTQ